MVAKFNTEDDNKLSFITFIIERFASSFKMDRQNAYLYLKKYGGLDFLFENWWALHTDNEMWAVRDLYEVCYENGGMR
jgi:hypothetical protein